VSLPDATPVLELIEAFRRSKTMFAAAALGIFDRLAEGSWDAATLARTMGVNAGALARLLDGCVGLGLLAKDGRGYSNTPLAQAYLRRSSPDTLVGYVLYSNRALYRLWANLEEAVREGTHRWTQTFGPEASLFDHYFKTEEAKRDFLMGMHGYGQVSSPPMVAAFDLSRFRSLVDLGGATGHMAIAACQRYAGLRAAVFDLPRVIPVTREYIERAGLAARIGAISGDFFQDPLPDADLYSLGRVLHDWSEEKIRRLLRKVCDRLPHGGALLVAEWILEEDKSGPLSALMQSLNMLVCTEGKERTLSEYAALLYEAGFSQVEGRKTGAPLDAILATK